MRAGFTLVELLITVLVAVILLTLGTVSVTGYQAQARDTERKADIAAIARGLEERYKTGYSYINDTLYPEQGRGMYPSVQEARYAIGTPSTCTDYKTPCPPASETLTQWLPSTQSAHFKAPGSTTISFRTTSVVPTSITDDGYVYVPFNAAGSVCSAVSGGCVRYNLYYAEETTGNMITVKSKHQ